MSADLSPLTPQTPAAPSLAASLRQSSTVLILLVSLWLATVGNLPLWRQLQALPEMGGARGFVFMGAFAVAIAAVLAALLSLFAWRGLLKPVAVLFLLSAAFGAHFMLAYRVVIDPTMMTNVLETGTREVADLLSLQMLLTVLFVGVLPAVAVWRAPLRHPPLRRALLRNLLLLLGALLVTVLALFAVFRDLASTMRNHTQVRYLVNPLNSFYALGNVATRSWRIDDRRLLPIASDVALGATYTQDRKPPLLVLTVGETGRRGNFSLNGYARPTNPELAKLDVVSQRGAVSCGTSTAASVPCMFSHLGKEAFEDRKSSYENLLDVLQRAGLAVLWLDNQGGCKGVCDRVDHASTAGETAAGQDAGLTCPDGECPDEVLLAGLEKRIEALDPARRARGVVLVLHPMGSHGPAYHKRSPAAFKRFLPECTGNNLQECSRDELLNAYDNSIVYTDHFLARTIEWLKRQESWASPAMVYVADHGESLGENNLYLHGLPYAIAPDVQKQVPWITWLSPAFSARRNLDQGCLRGRVDEPISHDHFFHSVLGLLDIHTEVYRPALDLYAPCAKAAGAPRVSAAP